MFKLVISLCFVAFAAASPIIDEQRAGRIVGGSNAAVGQFPFMASIRSNGVHLCGGALIGARWALSAAHCTRTLAAGSTTVVVGSNRLSTGTSHGVSRIVNNPGFDHRIMEHDISLVQTETTVVFNTNVQPANVGSPLLTAGTIVTIVGFGRTTQDGPLSETLQWMTAPIITQNNCRSRFGVTNAPRVQESHTCTLSPAGQGLCFGDGGTPAMVGNDVVAVNSWGIPCATGSPDVHTRTGLYRAWISLITGL